MYKNLSALLAATGLSPCVWVFDNDGTLYQQSHEASMLVEVLMDQFFAVQMGLSMEEAADFRRELRRLHSTKFTYHAVNADPRFDLAAFSEATYGAVNPKDFGLAYDPLVVNLIQRLRKTAARLYVLTNNPRLFALRTTHAQGLSGLFHDVFGIDEMHFDFKPSPGGFAPILARHPAAHPSEIVIVEDNYANCVAAADLGWTTVWLTPFLGGETPPHYAISSLV